MKTIIDIPTKGDDMTNAGGIVLRVRDEKPCYVVHYYHYDDRSQDGRGYIQGGYHTELACAILDLQQRVRRAEGWERGGSIDIKQLIER